MRSGLVGFFRVALATASIGGAAGCAAHRPAPANAGSAVPGPQVSGVWDAVTSGTIDEGVAAGDVKIEKQEWHLSQSGSAVAGYYIAALTFVSGDGRPYVCSRQPQFSTVQRFDVSGRVRAGAIEIEELTQRAAVGRCDPGARRLTHYSGKLQGDVLTLESEGLRQTLYRNHSPGGATAAAAIDLAVTTSEPAFPNLSDGPAASVGQSPADVSGLWVW